MFWQYTIAHVVIFYCYYLTNFTYTKIMTFYYRTNKNVLTMSMYIVQLLLQLCCDFISHWTVALTIFCWQYTTAVASVHTNGCIAVYRDQLATSGTWRTVLDLLASPHRYTLSDIHYLINDYLNSHDKQLWILSCLLHPFFRDLVYTSVGVIVNMMSDWDKRTTLR